MWSVKYYSGVWTTATTYVDSFLYKPLLEYLTSFGKLILTFSMHYKVVSVDIHRNSIMAWAVFVTTAGATLIFGG